MPASPADDRSGARTPSAGWDAVLRAGDALEALRDALFVVEELREEHAAMWAAAPTHAPPARPSTSALLRSLDEASGRLVAAHGLGAGRIGQARDAPAPAASACASLEHDWEQVDARVSATLDALQTDRVLIVLHDVCAQAHRLMDSLESALRQYASAAPSDDDARRVYETRRAHYVPACRSVLAVLRTNAETYAALQPRAQQHIDAVHARWHALEPRLESPAEPLAAAMQRLALGTPRRPREKRRARDSDAERRASAGTPSKLPRTPAPRTPVTTGAQTEPRHVGRLDVRSARHDTPERARSVLDARTPSTPGLYYKPPPATPPPAADGRPRRESMLPRLSRTAEEPTPLRRASHQHELRTRASIGALRPRFSSSELPRPVRTSSAYVPDARDALDVGVARICNVRRVPVERIDAGGAHDEYHRYALLSKTVACRLLQAQRPEVAQHVDPRHIHVRVGGGWRELAQWIDAHTFV
ncbi:hypothetical protein MOBT1_000322 [Malassezia obtusa]|uniref:GAR domain-containing protein n=1 Tax=Malassezia obtusa TaxID=76774 RepID=A0AAF0DXX0_9BASI|nr:hypothetical protein MOBT1_000322 [Malassezia obtusa]